MSSVLVFVPTTASRWRPQVAADVVEGFAATTSLREALGYRSDQDEDAEHAAMVLASVAGLARHGVRFVLACEVDASAVRVESTHDDAPNGRVVTGPIAQSRIVSWFTDEDGVDVDAAAHAAAGQTLDEAWDTDEGAALVAEHALLWHAAEELPGAEAGTAAEHAASLGAAQRGH